MSLKTLQVNPPTLSYLILPGIDKEVLGRCQGGARLGNGKCWGGEREVLGSGGGYICMLFVFGMDIAHKNHYYYMCDTGLQTFFFTHGIGFVFPIGVGY